MLELDTKQKVLLAIYTEYQKDLPEMDSIKPGSLGISTDVFNVAIEKLMNEGFIRGAEIVYGGSDPYPLMVYMAGTKMTRTGIEYVEAKLDVDKKASGHEKVKSVIKKAGEWGWDQFKDFGARVLAEMMKE